MGLTVTCGNCQASYRVGEQLAGKRVKCPKCEGVILVSPAAPTQVVPQTNTRVGGGNGNPPVRADGPSAKARSTAATQAARQQMLVEIRGAIQGTIKTARVPFYYPLGLLLAVLVMVVLIVIYLAIIGAVCYAVYWHATHDAVIFQYARGRAAIVALAIYVAPLLAGPILIFFLLKPLFARSGQQIPPVSVTREREPLLFEFVETICRAVGAPMPRRIDVDVNVNASASFRRGIASMLFGRDLVLTIGLPLAAGMDTRQLAGVLAHEFGHFRQGAGMRLSFLVRQMAFWFTRIVYDRDSWDGWLAQMANTDNGTVNAVFHFVRGCVWVTRRILWVLMLVGHFVAGFLVRQMEYDADRFETLVAGSETFERTSRELTFLSVAFQGAIADLRHFYQEGRLGDNLPKLLMHNAQEMPAEVRQALDKYQAESKTGIFDTHPCDRDRIAAAKRMNAAGVFAMQRPAILLFSSFGTLARQATLAFYREAIGDEFRTEMVHAVDSLLDRKSRETDAVQSLARQFQGSFSVLRPLPIADDFVEKRDLATERDAIERARQVIAAEKANYEEALKKFDRADEVSREIGQASALIDAGFSFPSDTFSVPLHNYEKIQAAMRSVQAQSGNAATRLRAMETAVTERIRSGLRLLGEPEIAAKIDDVAALREEVARLLKVHGLLVELFPQLMEYRRTGAAMQILTGQLQAHRDKASLVGMIKSHMIRLHNQLGDIFKRLVLVKYPFEHGQADISIADYLVPKLPTDDDLAALLESYSAMMDKVPALYLKLTSRLSKISEQVEAALGLPPMADITQDAAGPK